MTIISTARLTVVDCLVTWLDPPKLLLLFGRSSLFWPLLVLVPRPENAYNYQTPRPPPPPPAPTHFFAPRHKTNNTSDIFPELSSVYSASTRLAFRYLLFGSCILFAFFLRPFQHLLFSVTNPIAIVICIYRHSNNTLQQYDICFSSTPKQNNN